MSVKKMGIMVSLVGMTLAAAPVFAADGDAKAPGKVEVQYSYRGGTIVGMPVHNDAGKKLGKIEDLVVDLGTGKIRYAALSFGGFLGVGDKLFAVPWGAMTFKYG